MANPINPTDAHDVDGSHGLIDPPGADDTDCTQSPIDSTGAGGNFLYPKIAPGRKIKIIPNLNHPAIIEFLNIVYPIQVRSWNDVLSVYISCPDLVFYKSVERFSYAGILGIFRRLFRIHQTQTLRKGISSEQDLIVLLRSIANKYDYHLQSFYTIKRPTKYCMVNNDM